MLTLSTQAEGVMHSRTYCEVVLCRQKPDANGKRQMKQSFVGANGFRLGWWQHKQRLKHRAGTLGAERTARLEDAGIGPPSASASV